MLAWINICLSHGRPLWCVELSSSSRWIVLFLLFNSLDFLLLLFYEIIRQILYLLTETSSFAVLVALEILFLHVIFVFLGRFLRKCILMRSDFSCWFLFIHWWELCWLLNSYTFWRSPCLIFLAYNTNFLNNFFVFICYCLCCSDFSFLISIFVLLCCLRCGTSTSWIFRVKVFLTGFMRSFSLSNLLRLLLCKSSIA